MRLIIDNRERELIPICEQFTTKMDPNYVTIEVEALPLGDILVKTDEDKDVLIVERKTLQDLLASIKDKRYGEQSHRLRYASGFAPHNVLYIIEGMYSSLRTSLEKNLVMSAITSLYYFKGFTVMRTASIYETAETLVQMANKIDRNFMKGVLPWYLNRPGASPSIAESVLSEPVLSTSAPAPAVTEENENNGGSETPYSALVKKVKKDNITPDNMGEIMLCQIPGISSLYAKAILKHFDGFSNLIIKLKEGTATFENITYDQKGKPRKIPKTCGEQIIKLLV